MTSSAARWIQFCSCRKIKIGVWLLSYFLLLFDPFIWILRDWYIGNNNWSEDDRCARTHYSRNYRALHFSYRFYISHDSFNLFTWVTGVISKHPSNGHMILIEILLFFSIKFITIPKKGSNREWLDWIQQ